MSDILPGIFTAIIASFALVIFGAPTSVILIVIFLILGVSLL